jgi:histidine phosphotransferase ChpT
MSVLDIIKNLKISELITVKISHDLAGAVGAVSNGLELALSDDEFVKDAMNLASKSADIVVSRLKFYRLLFGSSNSGLMELPLVKGITEDYIKSLSSKSSQIVLDWQAESFMSEDDVRICLLLISIAGENLVRGGEIKITNEKIIVSGIINFSEELNNMLSKYQQNGDILWLIESATPQTVTILLAELYAIKTGKNLKLTKENDKATIFMVD